MNLLAIKTLEDALMEARDGPVTRDHGHRLALAWLAHQKIGLDWHYKAFWDAMAATNGGGVQDGGQYVRTTYMTGLLDYWRRQLGIAV